MSRPTAVIAEDEPLLRAELRETLRVHLREGSSASASARALFAHRNTVLNRLGRAQELLPRALEDSRLDVALALEIDHWRAG